MAVSISAASLLPNLSPTIPRTRITSPSSLSLSSSFFNNALTHQSSRAANRRRTRTRAAGLSCTCFFGLGVPELVVIAGVAALVFGPKQLPEVGRTIGKTVKSFQQAAKEFETELKKEPESGIESPVEEPGAASEEGKKEVEVSSTKDSL